MDSIDGIGVVFEDGVLTLEESVYQFVKIGYSVAEALYTTCKKEAVWDKSSTPPFEAYDGKHWPVKNPFIMTQDHKIATGIRNNPETLLPDAEKYVKTRQPPH